MGTTVRIVARALGTSAILIQREGQISMAQHIPIKQFRQKMFRTIEASIHREVKRGIRGSLKYELMPPEYNNAEDDAVYLTSRHVGKGFIWGSDRADFEVHLFGKEVNVIYLVA